jgi:hypothetical protein
MNRSAHSPIKIALVFAFYPFVFLLFPSLIECQTPSASENSTAAPVALLDGIAEKTAAVAKKAGCDRIDCKFLVSDMNTTAGSTSEFGVRFSDKFSQALVKFLPAGDILDRSVLRDFLREQRIPSKLLSESSAARWMGKKFGATIIILPVLSFAKDSQVSFKLVKVDSGKVIESHELKIALVASSMDDLRAVDGYGPVGARAARPANEPTYAFGPKNPKVKFPQCFYTPSPPYSSSARSIYFSGTLLVEAIISKDGNVVDPRVIRGLPYDLNEMAMATITTWRCRPAVLDGNAVAVVVPFEITFRPN